MNMPVLFLSHGAPTLPLDEGETVALWRQIASRISHPTAILVISAHWETQIPTVGSTLHPETIHDFSGFPEVLYTLRYPAPGAPALAHSVVEALHQAKIKAALDDARGLDHGAWIPLSLMYPKADIPVAQLSIQSEQSPGWHLAMGRALRPLREQGVLIIGSGAITHNLRAIFRHQKGEEVPVWVEEFCDWIASRIKAGDLDSLTNYRALAPYAVQNHPTDEHLLPLFAALGAAHNFAKVRHMNHVMTYGIMAMDAFEFDGEE